MKIEKISDTQIKFILNREDFAERGLSLAELTYNSEKVQRLFKDMMELAFVETGFEADRTPLVIEAVPISLDSVMVIVTKTDKENVADSPVSSLFSRLSRENEEFLSAVKTEKFRNYQGITDGRQKRVPKNIAIYSFESLDDVSLAAARLNAFFRGASSLYKYEGKYYICLQLPFKTAVLKMGELENVLGEYGEKHVSNTVSRGFLLEHGETLINANAVNKMASL